MNRRSPGLQLSKALVGFLQYKAAEGLSPNTLRNYKDHLTRWLDYAGDIEIGQVTSQDLRAYLAWLRTDHKPRRLAGGDHPFSLKTARNVWAALSSFFAWASWVAPPTVGQGRQRWTWRRRGAPAGRRRSLSAPPLPPHRQLAQPASL